VPSRSRAPPPANRGMDTTPIFEAFADHMATVRNARER